LPEKKHPSLLQKFVNYGQKSFRTLVSGLHKHNIKRSITEAYVAILWWNLAIIFLFNLKQETGKNGHLNERNIFGQCPRKLQGHVPIKIFAAVIYCDKI
jgi:hypothetical protein